MNSLDAVKIVEFLGVKAENGEYELYGVLDFIEDGPDEKHFYKPAEMLFDESWDWLIPVVRYALKLATEQGATDWIRTFEKVVMFSLDAVYGKVLDFINALSIISTKNKLKSIEYLALKNRQEVLDNLNANGSSEVTDALDVLEGKPKVWDVIMDKKFRVAVATIAHEIAEKDGMAEEPLFEVLIDEDYKYLTDLGHRFASFKFSGIDDKEFFIEYDSYTTLFYVAPYDAGGIINHDKGKTITEVEYID